MGVFYFSATKFRLFSDKKSIIYSIIVAEYLGVTYRHLLYVIAKFVKSGILEKSEQGYVIKNESALRKITTIDKEN